MVAAAERNMGDGWVRPMVLSIIKGILGGITQADTFEPAQISLSLSRVRWSGVLYIAGEFARVRYSCAAVRVRD